MQLNDFRQAIDEENWSEASIFGYDPEENDNLLIIDLVHAPQNIYDPQQEQIAKAVDWLLEGAPGDHRAILLQKSYDPEGEEAYALKYMQVGIFDDGKLSAEYQILSRGEKTWEARNFWKDFEPEAYHEVLALLNYYNTTAKPLKSMSQWKPVVLAQNE